MGKVRISTPLKALSTSPYIETNFNYRSFSLSKKKEVGRIFIWQRPIFRNFPRSMYLLKKMFDHDYIIVIDWDDDPSHWGDLRPSIELAFQSVHAVQVSTPELVKWIRPFNPEVTAFPNALLSMPTQVAPSSIQRVGLRLFFGALNRKNDWMPLIKALNRELNNAPGFWSFTVVHDLEFFNSLDLPNSQKKFVPTCSYQDYLTQMSDCDIAFLPLTDNHFNRMKSNLKAIEAGSYSLALLASKTVYAESLIDGHTAALFVTAAEMEKKLRDFRLNPDLAYKLGKRACSWVLNHGLLSNQIERREDWYRSLIDKRKLLDESIRKRVPIMSQMSIKYSIRND